MSYLSTKLLNMAEHLDVDLGPSEEDRIALRDAAYLLGAKNLGDVAKLILTDNNALRAGLAQLANKQVGVVLALVLRRLDGTRDTPLPELMRVLASQVEELIETLEG